MQSSQNGLWHFGQVSRQEEQYSVLQAAQVPMHSEQHDSPQS